ncbi:fasciclin domain-containing protein [Gemmatimonadota bacterium Y43]|uniref:fasciclin domain-containing protein n=1 Tax=Gaopeijia maritima TaxID=3119007 RepID=UPI00328DD259
MRSLRTLSGAGLALAATLFAAACTDSAPPTAPPTFGEDVAAEPTTSTAPGTIADIVVSLATGDDPEFTVLLKALQVTGLVPAVAGDDMLTVFAPTDAAFLALLERSGFEPAALNDLGSIDDDQKQLLTSILLYHVVPGALFSGDVLGAASLQPLAGGMLTPLANDEGAFIVDEADSSPNAQLLAPDLIDIAASNGVIHVIDEVLLPMDLDLGDDSGDDGEEPQPMPSIADIVVSLATGDDPEFTVLLKALQVTGLVPAVAGDDMLTVFAPTDAAFLALLERSGFEPAALSDLGSIDDDQKQLLTSILLYHVVPGALFSGDVLGAASLQPLAGGMLTPLANDEGAFIVDEADSSPNAQLLAPDLIDIAASNGVIHVIDEVLLPMDLDLGTH